MTMNSDRLGCTGKCWIAAILLGLVVMVFLLLSSLSVLASMFVGVVAGGLVGLLLTWLLCTPAERVRTALPSEPVDPQALVASGGSETPAAPAPAPKPEPMPAAKPAAAAKPVAAAKPAPAPSAAKPAAVAPVAAGGTRPAALDAPRGGTADDLKKIKGVGPKLEALLHSLGFYHFDQIAGWTAGEVAWVDENLKGFKGRVSRDNWVAQASTLAAGGETEFSRKVDKGGVY